MLRYKRYIGVDKKYRKDERLRLANDYLLYAQRFYDAGYREDAHLFAEIALILDPQNKKLKNLISRL